MHLHVLLTDVRHDASSSNADDGCSVKERWRNVPTAEAKQLRLVLRRQYDCWPARSELTARVQCAYRRQRYSSNRSLCSSRHASRSDAYRSEAYIGQLKAVDDNSSDPLQRAADHTRDEP